MKSKPAEALKRARQAAASAHTWIELHNAVFGIGGLTADLFRTPSERTAFLKTPEYKTIRGMIDDLRTEHGDPPAISAAAAKANGRILLRVPRAIHAALLAESEAEDVSLNQLLLSKVCLQLAAASGK